MTDIPSVDLPPRRVLLDGGMGRELRHRGIEIPDTIWSANALLESPDTVRDVHADYIAAGADVIITNTYGIIRAELAREGLEERFAELNVQACKLAQEARAAGGRQVLIAGSLPPLRGSYRPDRVGPYDEIEPLYREQAEILMPHVDLFICETMSSARRRPGRRHRGGVDRPSGVGQLDPPRGWVGAACGATRPSPRRPRRCPTCRCPGSWSTAARPRA